MARRLRTQVAIVGAGPAGLILGRLLRAQGVDTVILEARDRGYVEQRVRAGVLEPGTVDTMGECGLDARLRREGLPQPGFDLRFAGRSHHVPVEELTGRRMTVYGQSEVVKDLIAARLADGDALLFEASGVELHDVDGERPWVSFRHGDEEQRLDCDVIAGCDGYHGVSRASMPSGVLREFQILHPFAWLGILVRVPPASTELVYTHHERGFALLTLRTPDVTRLYVQCRREDSVEDWPDERVWDELDTRLATDDGFEQPRGPVLDKGVTYLRSFVAEPMQYGRLFLAGDAAHVVPPTGAKGLNMAVADARELARALTRRYRDGDDSSLRAYSDTCLRRVWRVQRFSWWMTSLLHRLPDGDEFRRRLQLSELEQIVAAPTAGRFMTRNYVGLHDT
jgi:p-hydroxybenzoate 3-monooxygenase